MVNLNLSAVVQTTNRNWLNVMHKSFVYIVNCWSENISRSMCNGTLNFGTTHCNDKKEPEHVDEKEIPILTTLSNVEEKTSNGTMSQRNDTSDSMNQSQSQSLTTTQLALIFVGSLWNSINICLLLSLPKKKQSNTAAE